MLLALVHKELLAHLRTLRLVVALVFTVVLCALTTLMSSLDYSVSVEAFEAARSEERQALSEVRLMGDVQPHVLVAPQPLTLLSRGIVEGAAMRYRVSYDRRQVSTSLVGSAAYDDLMLILVRTDLTTVVALVLSFLAVVLGFDAICGERERGTLKLLLSNPVARTTVVGAKLIGGALALWLPLALAYVVSLLILLGNSNVAFSGDDWLRLILMFALSCLLLLLIYALSVMVSSFTRSPATSLVVCLFGWLIGGVGYANALPSLMRYGLSYPPYRQYVEQEEEASERFERDVEAWELRNPRPADPYMGHRSGGAVRYASREGHVWLAKHGQFMFDRMLERADEEYSHRWPNQQPLAEQEFAVDRWSILSPLTNYRTLCKWLARSTLDDRFEVARYGAQYRRTLIQWMRGRLQANGWRRFYTDDPPDQMPMIADPASVAADSFVPGSQLFEERMAWARVQDEQAEGELSRRLDVSGMPQPGEGSRRTLGESLRQMLPGLSVMLLTLGLATLITIRRFQRYALN